MRGSSSRRPVPPAVPTTSSSTAAHPEQGPGMTEPVASSSGTFSLRNSSATPSASAFAFPENNPEPRAVLAPQILQRLQNHRPLLRRQVRRHDQINRRVQLSPPRQTSIRQRAQPANGAPTAFAWAPAHPESPPPVTCSHESCQSISASWPNSRGAVSPTVTSVADRNQQACSKSQSGQCAALKPDDQQSCQQRLLPSSARPASRAR